jgi:hypothetical protein
MVLGWNLQLLVGVYWRKLAFRVGSRLFVGEHIGFSSISVILTLC